MGTKLHDATRHAHFMDTPNFTKFYLTDTVESVADPDWEKERCIYTLNRFGPHTYLQSTIFMTTTTNDVASPV